MQGPHVDDAHPNSVLTPVTGIAVRITAELVSINRCQAQLDLPQVLHDQVEAEEKISMLILCDVALPTIYLKLQGAETERSSMISFENTLGICWMDRFLETTFM